MKKLLLFLALNPLSAMEPDNSKALIPYQNPINSPNSLLARVALLNEYQKLSEKYSHTYNEQLQTLEQYENPTTSDLQRSLEIAALACTTAGTIKAADDIRTKRSLITSLGLIAGVGGLTFFGGCRLYSAIEHWMIGKALAKVENRLVTIEQDFSSLRDAFERVRNRQDEIIGKVDSADQKLSELIAKVHDRIQLIKLQNIITPTTTSTEVQPTQETQKKRGGWFHRKK